MLDRIIKSCERWSQNPQADCQALAIKFYDQSENIAVVAISNLAASMQCLEEYLTKQSKDPICFQVINHSQEEWSSKQYISSQLKPYILQCEKDINCQRYGLLLFNQCIVVITSFQKGDWTKLHLRLWASECCFLWMVPVRVVILTKHNQ